MCASLMLLLNARHGMDGVSHYQRVLRCPIRSDRNEFPLLIRLSPPRWGGFEFISLVEPWGIEPQTSALRTRRSPS